MRLRDDPFLIVCLLIVLAFSAGAVAQDFTDETGTARRSGYQKPAPVVNAPSLGFGTGQGSTTISIPASGLTNLGQHVASDAKVVCFNFFGSDIILNNGTDLATGSIFRGWKVASGGYYLEKELGRPIASYTLYAAPNSTSAATATQVYWK
jgi:hypothetical protein